MQVMIFETRDAPFFIRRAGCCGVSRSTKIGNLAVNSRGALNGTVIREAGKKSPSPGTQASGAL
jgi:hypothetical protein